MIVLQIIAGLFFCWLCTENFIHLVRFVVLFVQYLPVSGKKTS